MTGNAPRSEWYASGNTSGSRAFDIVAYADALHLRILEDGFSTATSDAIVISLDEIAFNENSASQNFRIESDGSENMFFVDATNNRIGIGTDTPSGALQIIDDEVRIGNAGTPTYAAGDGDLFVEDILEVGNMIYSVDGLGHVTDTDTYMGFKDDEIYYYVGGLNFLTFKEDSLDTVVFNEGGHAISFRVESDGNENMFFVDAGNNRVGIGTNSPLGALHIIGDEVRIGNAGTPIYAAGDGDLFVEDVLEVGNMIFSIDGLSHVADADTYMGFKDDEISYYVGGLNFLTFNEDVLDTVVFNEGGHEIDFRIESNHETSMFFVDANHDSVGIGVDSPTAYLEVKCPDGFTSVKSGYNQLGCIQTAEKGSARYEDAQYDCFHTYGGRLPTTGELYIAMSHYTLTDETDDWERCSDHIYAGGGDQHSAAARGDISTQTGSDDGDNMDYRCWLPR